MKALLILTFLIFFSLNSRAHPVIYQGGWALSSTNYAEFSNNYALYSFTNRFAAGLENNRFGKEDFTFAKFNTLLWRKNGDESQANLYLHTGAGELFTYGAEADWETRTLYSSLKHLRFEGRKDFSITQARVGLSPVKTPFDQLQTWFMVQGMLLHGVDEKVMITPMLRFFYHNVLWEMGSSTKGDWMLNLMVHY